MGRKTKSGNALSQRLSKREDATIRTNESSKLLDELWWLLPALLLGFLIYLNTLHGAFVYDDQLQISRNTFIQDRSQFWRALTSDVWKFQTGDQTNSNYWRPTFVLWLIVSFQLFGFNVVGWHMTNVLLHLAVVALAFAVVRQFGVSRPVAAGIALIFAVHPVHTESVAWISGAPDLLVSVGLLGSLYFLNLLGEKQTLLRWLSAIGFYVIALGAKEVATLFPLLIVVVLGASHAGSKTQSKRWTQVLGLTWPFVVAALVYLAARKSVLGGVTQPISVSGITYQDAILTLPSISAFYLRQMIFPWWIGPTYSLRAVTEQTIGLSNFVLPLVVTIVVAGWLSWQARRSKVARIGLALFLVPLLPAMNIVAFQAEQIVHDRYLYLPLLGFLLVVFPLLASWLKQIGSSDQINGRFPLIYLVALGLSVPLIVQSAAYNRVWTSELALWKRGIESDPGSATNYQRYGTALTDAKRLDEAVAAFDRSIALSPLASTYIVRAAVWNDQQKFAEAERDLRVVVSQESVTGYTLYRAYRDLAASLSSQGKADEAAKAIREGRIRLPQYAAALTGKLSSVLLKVDKKEEALQEMNSMRAQARSETLPESRLLIYGIGLLNVELGHPKEAREAFLEFLALTNGMEVPGVKQARAEAEARVRELAP